MDGKINAEIFQNGLNMRSECSRMFIEIEPDAPKLKAAHLPVQHDLKTIAWCGLTALSVLTGEHTSLARDLIRRKRKKRGPVTGITLGEMREVLDTLGYLSDLAYMYGGYAPNSRPLLSQWLEDTADQRVRHLPYLIALDGNAKDKCGHWAVLLNDKYICSQCDGWVDAARAPTLRLPVDYVCVVYKVPMEV